MAQVFIAGPVDLQDLEFIVSYRLELQRALSNRGLTPVDQYSELLERLAGDDDRDLKSGLVEIADSSDRPYARAIRTTIEQKSVEAVASSPELVLELVPDSLIAEIVEYDLGLVEESDAFLAYLPTPSCGTTVELLHAEDCGLPTAVVSEQPPLFVQHYADDVYNDVESAAAAFVKQLETDRSRSGQ
jgi:hypothetical protein